MLGVKEDIHQGYLLVYHEYTNVNTKQHVRKDKINAFVYTSRFNL